MSNLNVLTETSEAPGHKTYSDTVARGYYGKHVGGLFGKHDNVRTYWEDQLTRLILRPHVARVAAKCRNAGRGVRVLDLGCGAGQGYELLTRINEKDLSMEDELRFVLPSKEIGLFFGVDISDAMVEQGRQNYSGMPNVIFEPADLSEGLGELKSQAPFDIYFSSYGPLSHLDTDSLKVCLGDILHHAHPGALVVLDLMGRYSPEWPLYWSSDDRPNKMLPYSMSYMYEEEERHSGEVEQFPIRFWTGDEVRELCRELTAHNGVAVRPLDLMDRSIFVGRHIDTREYGCPLPPLRSMVNHLYELNVRTKLEHLRVDYQPLNGHRDLDRFFAELALCWNTIVDFTLERLQGNRIDLVDLDGWRNFPPQLQTALMTMDRVIDSVSWIDLGDIRANVLEPQLAYVLRRLEFTLQRGQGCGHSLVAVLQVG
ncbi:MAG: methyltransferase domain-containing protein [Deltaproteobacteria bacterium]|nr:methyltransferase domain-containing protein [Deltaproteobacteria bacterium]